MTTETKTIFIACPWTPLGGGMFKVADYLVQSQRSGAMAKLEPLDTRGSGRPVFSLFVLLGAIGRLITARLRNRVAGVHINMAERLSLFRKAALLLFARAIGIPVVLHLHAAQLQHFYRSLPAPARAFVCWTFSRASRVVVLGQAARNFVTQDLRVPPQQVEIVINGVPPPMQPRAPLSADMPQARVLFLGNLSERKGVSDLLQALSRSYQAANGCIDAVFAGGGDISAYTEKAQKLGVASYTRFVGWADQSQAAQWMASADVLVLPSYDEGLPLVILEALANGVAVICTPVGEIPHALQDGHDVLMVPPGDTDALALALDRLVADQALRHALAAQGNAKYHEKFSLDKFSDAVADVHRRVFGVSAR